MAAPSAPRMQSGSRAERRVGMLTVRRRRCAEAGRGLAGPGNAGVHGADIKGVPIFTHREGTVVSTIPATPTSGPVISAVDIDLAEAESGSGGTVRRPRHRSAPPTSCPPRLCGSREASDSTPSGLSLALRRLFHEGRIFWPRGVRTARRPHLPKCTPPQSSSTPASCSSSRRWKPPQQTGPVL